METSSSFFSKIIAKKNANQIKVEKKKQQFCFLHDLIINPRPYRLMNADHQKGQDFYENDDLSCHNPKTQFYLCRKFQHSVEFQKLPMYLIKRIAYRKQNIKDDQGRIIYNDEETKSYDQVATQFHCLELLKGSHRSIQLIQVLHQNTKLKQDKNFFYQALNLQDRRSQQIRNICFVLEEMNGGSLYDLIMKETKFSEDQIVEYSCQIAEGLLQLQSKGIIHRDLRPGNILFHNGQIKFADYDAAFITGYSDYRNIKNGVDMTDTTPQEIMMLVAESEQNLKSLSNEKLFQMQERADVYFLGVSIYCMVFSQFFQSFNHRYLKVITNNKKRMGFCAKILQVMQRCLQKNPHHRIQLKEVVDILAKLERQFYLKSSQYKRVYLSPQPLNLYSFSSNQMEEKIKSQSNYIKVYCKYNREEMEKNIFQAIKFATLQRKTNFYSKLFNNLIQASSSSPNIWKDNPKSSLIKSQRLSLFQRIEKLLQRLQIKAYYYEFAYRILCEVNLGCIQQPIYFQNIRSHIQLFSSELVVILTFIYETMMKRSFTTDPSYQQTNIGYENKRIVENIRILHSRWQFFSGRLRLQKEANNRVKLIKKSLKDFNESQKKEENEIREAQQLSQKYRLQFQCVESVQSLEQMIAKYRSISYGTQQQRLSFAHQQRTLMKLLQRIELNIKNEMIQTIINLIIAYEKIKMETWGHQSNLKNAIFMLMILDAQNTETVQKNDLVIIKQQLITMINMNLGWRSEELEAFFTNYTQTHTLQVVRGLQQLQSCALINSQQQSESELNIQINILKQGQGQGLLEQQGDTSVVVTKSKSNKNIQSAEQRNDFVTPQSMQYQNFPVKELVEEQNLDDGSSKMDSKLKKDKQRETVEYQVFDSVTQSFQEEQKQKIKKAFPSKDVALQIQD